MSKFSGKCDLYDCIEIHGVDHIMNCKIYIKDSTKPLEINSLADLVPYYPYVPISMGMNNVDNTGTIRLTDRPYYEIEKEEFDKYGLKHYMYNTYKKKLQEEIDRGKKEGESFEFI